MTDVYEIWSPKGGQGVTTIAALLAVGSAAHGLRTTLVMRADHRHAVTAFGRWADPDRHSWHLAPELEATSGSLSDPIVQAADVIVTDGLDPLPLVNVDRHQRIMVLRNCYLALMAAVSHPETELNDLVVGIIEPGRALDRIDIERTLGRCDVALAHDPAIGRAVDAGLLGDLGKTVRPTVDRLLATIAPVVPS